MLVNDRKSWLLSIGCAAVFALIAGSLHAADEAPANAAAKRRLSGPKLEGRYALPEGDSAALQKFMEDLQKEIKAASEVQMKGPTALRAAANKILETETDKKSPVYQYAYRYLLPTRIRTLVAASPKERDALIEEVLESLKSADSLTMNDVQTAHLLGGVVERGKEKDTQAAIKLNQSLGEIFSRSSDSQIASAGAKFMGTARRLDLPGHKMVIEGAAVNRNDTFDWASYRGKVVLVDFWATWCGPCRAELPNVKENYQKYHDKGFDVVGISIDEDRDKLDEFLEKDPVPWVILNEKNGGWNSKIAEYYGVNGIPCVILVDKEGKVVSLNARGPELGRLLEEQLGAATK